MSGWTIEQSIAMELDAAFSLLGGYAPTRALPPEMAALAERVPDDWRAQMPVFLGEARQFVSFMSELAYFADTVVGGDYAQVTGGIRELTLEQALVRLIAEAQTSGLEPNSALAPGEQLIDLTQRLDAAAHERLGLSRTYWQARSDKLAQDYRRMLRVLRGGDLHARFWHWLDRFYYESYGPWRRTRAEFMDQLDQHAAILLGARARDSAVPDLAWLPAQSPLLRVPELYTAIQTGQLRVVFWVEPFGLVDSWGLSSDFVIASFAQPGALYQNFQAFAEDIAGRAKAIADPTRLIILRMIRHFGAINTEMAEFLELARPTVSIHAKILREAGLIRSRQEGRQVRHELVPEEVRRLLRDLEHFLDLPETTE